MRTQINYPKMHSLFTLFILMIVMCKQAIAQPAINRSTYNTAVGLRLGETSGLTIKHFVNGGDAAVDGIVGIWSDAISLTCLYEKHAYAGLEGLTWYYGGGGHLFFESGNNKYYYRDRYYNYYNNRSYYTPGGVGIGIDGIIGLEYKIRPIPFALSIDLKPFFEVNSNGLYFFVIDPGFGIKFTF